MIALSALTVADESLPQAFRIAVDGGADSLGQIVITFAEDGAEAFEIPVSIPKGMPENDVARRIRKEATKIFGIRLGRSTISGTEISIAHD